MCYPDKALVKEVSIPYPLFQSQNGDYFIGQTPILTGEDKHAASALVNPANSESVIYVNAITVTNISNVNLSAEFYVKSSLKNPLVSTSVSCANLGLSPTPIPEGEIQYLPSTTIPPENGVSIFSRIVPPYSTLVIDGSQIILQPGQSLIVYLGGFLPINPNSTIVAWGWYEDCICGYPCYGCQNALCK